jgi:hypothetical protein
LNTYTTFTIICIGAALASVVLFVLVLIRRRADELKYMPRLPWKLRQEIKYMPRLTRKVRRESRELNFDSLPGLFPDVGWAQGRNLLIHRKRAGDIIVDEEATVIATAATLSYQVVTTNRLIGTEYLFLIERRKPEDHLASIARSIVVSLRNQSVPVIGFEYSGDPKLTTEVGHRGRLVNLGELRGRYPNHRLVLVTAGDRLVDTSYLGIRNAPEFEYWEEKFLMTPRSEYNFGRTEAAFRDSGFEIIGVGTTGLRKIAGVIDGAKRSEFFSAPTSAILPSQSDDRLIDDQPLSDSMIQELLERVREGLGERHFAWMAACAVYPLLIPKLTEFLGLTVTNDLGKSLGDEEGYVRLCSLPWFREGTIPDWLRVKLVRGMSKALSDQVREALISAIETGSRASTHSNFVEEEIISSRPAET